jgi:hypothetical protein
MTWISTKDKLPDRMVKVLLIIYDEIYVGWRYKHGPWVTINSKYQCSRGNGKHYVFDKHVTYWMLLPKPNFLIEWEIIKANRVPNPKYIKNRFKCLMGWLQIKNIEQFSGFTRSELLKHRNVGKKLVDYVESELKKLCLSLKQEED